MTAGAATTAAADGRALLDRIKPVKRREVTYLCLRPDLLDEWDTENRLLEQMRAEDIEGSGEGTGPKTRLADRVAKVTARTKKQAAKVKALEDQIAETQIMFVLEPLSRPEFKAICAANPPRPENIIDQTVGYNRDEVTDQLVRPCVVDPVFDDDAWEELVAVLAPSEWDELKETAQRANGKVVDAPKSRLAETLLRGPNVRPSQPRKSGG